MIELGIFLFALLSLFSNRADLSIVEIPFPKVKENTSIFCLAFLGILDVIRR